MAKKVLILSGSPRKGGNSDLLCREFARGAQESGCDVEILRVAAKKIAPCSGCYYCRAHNGECAHKDDMAEVLQKMIDADVIVMASPVYFYSIDAQLKAVIDRTVARWLVDDGAEVGAGTPVVVLEAMKMEIQVTAPIGGVVHIAARPGDSARSGSVLGHIES